MAEDNHLIIGVVFEIFPGGAIALLLLSFGKGGGV